jgi:hypothetical protein
MRLYEYDITLCNCGCGLPVGESHDKDQFFIVDEDICYARRAIEKVRAQKREQAMQRKKGDGWDAGLKLHVRTVTRAQALEHMERQHQQAKSDDEVVGPRLAAAQAQRVERDERLGARAREQAKQQRVGLRRRGGGA